MVLRSFSRRGAFPETRVGYQLWHPYIGKGETVVQALYLKQFVGSGDSSFLKSLHQFRTLIQIDTGIGEDRLGVELLDHFVADAQRVYGL